NDLANSLLALPNFNTQEAGILAGIGIGTAAVIGLGVVGLVGGSIAIGGTGVAGTGLLGAIWPETVGSGLVDTIVADVAAEGASPLAAAGASVLGPILVVVGMIVAGVFFAIDLFQAARLVPQLATTIADAPTTAYDVSGVSSDKNQLTQLFTL